MKQFDDLKAKVHSFVLNYRRIDYLISTEKFQIIYLDCVAEDQATFGLLIEKGNYDALCMFMEKMLESNIEHYTVKQLRKLAQQYNIPFYFTLSKAELLSRILHAKSLRNNDNGNEGSSARNPSNTT